MDAGDVSARQPLGAPPFDRGARIATIGTFLILLFGALYYARAFFLPLILALLISLTFAPFVRMLSWRRVPPAVSAILVVAGLAGIFAVLAVFLADPVAQMIEDAPAFAETLKRRLGEIKGPLSAIEAAGDRVGEIVAPPDVEQPEKVVIAQPGLLPAAAGVVTDIATTLGATLVFAVFLLASGDLFLLKLVRAVPSLTDKKRTVRIVHDIEAEVSRYLLTVSAINLGFGAAVAIAMALIGMPHPEVFGIAAALLNYIPYLGAITGIGIAAAVGIVTFPTLGLAAVPPIVYFALHLVESLIVTPLTLGRRLELNTVAILVALALAGWMWSIVGALIAVPLLVVVKVFSDHFPGLATFGEFLSGDGVPEEAKEAKEINETREPSLRSSR